MTDTTRPVDVHEPDDVARMALRLATIAGPAPEEYPSEMTPGILCWSDRWSEAAELLADLAGRDVDLLRAALHPLWDSDQAMPPWRSLICAARLSSQRPRRTTESAPSPPSVGRALRVVD